MSWGFLPLYSDDDEMTSAFGIDDDLEECYDGREWLSLGNSGTAATQVVYTRGTEIISCTNPKNSKVSKGRRGTLDVKGHQFPTIERMDGYIWLRPGEYVCKHDKSKGGCLRPKHEQKNSRGYTAGILIHKANWTYQLAGCIAPGLKAVDNLSGRGAGVSSSTAAMNKIFELLGGFSEGSESSLQVIGEMY